MSFRRSERGPNSARERIATSVLNRAISSIDDWGPETLNADQRRDLFEIVEDRQDRRSIIITSQVPVDQWYEIIGNPTIADAILDRLIHYAYRIELNGESLRKRKIRPVQIPCLDPRKGRDDH